MKTVENVKPLVSVLIAAYNQEDYIAQTLDSVLMQECPFDYEILIGEDCSDDRTRDICLEYARNHPDKIRLFLNEQNKGLINNYFDILKQARGEYLADCGGDDYWLTTDKLNRQVALLMQHPEVSLVYGNWQMLHQKSGLLETNRIGRSEDWFDPECFGMEAVKDYLNKQKVPVVVLSTACFRTDRLNEAIQSKQNLFRSENVVCEDLPITLCLLLKGPFYLMKEELMVYRVLEKSVSHSETIDDNLKGFSFKVFMQTIELTLGLGLSLNKIKPYVHRTFPNFIFFAFITNDKEWMNLVVRTVKGYGIKLNLKQLIMYICTQNKVTSWLVLHIYRLIKGKRKNTWTA